MQQLPLSPQATLRVPAPPSLVRYPDFSSPDHIMDHREEKVDVEDDDENEVMMQARQSFEKRHEVASEDLAEFLALEQAASKGTTTPTTPAPTLDPFTQCQQFESHELSALWEKECEEGGEKGTVSAPQVRFMAAADTDLDEEFFREQMNIDESVPWEEEQEEKGHRVSFQEPVRREEEYASHPVHRQSHGGGIESRVGPQIGIGRQIIQSSEGIAKS